MGIARVVRAFEMVLSLSPEDALAGGDGETDLVMGRIRRMGYRKPGLVGVDVRVVERLGCHCVKVKGA